jgi:hypothetical protein
MLQVANGKGEKFCGCCHKPRIAASAGQGAVSDDCCHKSSTAEDGTSVRDRSGRRSVGRCKVSAFLAPPRTTRSTIALPGRPSWSNMSVMIYSGMMKAKNGPVNVLGLHECSFRPHVNEVDGTACLQARAVVCERYQSSFLPTP